jgi:hypothetical protein
MKLINLKFNYVPVAMTSMAALLLTGCAAWNGTPERVASNYGTSVRDMVANQTLNPNKAQYPAALAPDGMEGNKGETVLQQTYRNDIGRPATVRQHSLLGTPSSSTSSGGGSSR